MVFAVLYHDSSSSRVSLRPLKSICFSLETSAQEARTFVMDPDILVIATSGDC